jgi:hypothetical protein
MLAADADLGEFGMLFGSLDGMRLRLRFDEANGLKTILESCEERGVSASGTEVRCAYDYHAIRSDEIGLGPFRGSHYDIIIRDGEVVSVSGAFFTENGFSRQVWGPFADWLAETYDDVLVMYTNGSQAMEQITDESMALWEERSREYVEFVRNSG